MHAPTTHHPNKYNQHETAALNRINVIIDAYDIPPQAAHDLRFIVKDTARALFLEGARRGIRFARQENTY